MPAGDAKRIRDYATKLVDDSRHVGEIEIIIRVGDVRDDLGLVYSDAAIDVCQVLETRKFKTETGVEFLSKTGPRHGVNTKYRFKI